MSVKIVTLVENTAANPELSPKHGLSLYVETPKHKLLFDVGPNEFFSENAKKLGIDLAQVDMVILSHGHYDHGGGLETFFAINDRAKVYIRREAFEPHYSRLKDSHRYIGLDEKVREHMERFVFVDDYAELDEELTLFSGVETAAVPSQSNSALCMEKDGCILQDDFNHEQNLILTAGGEKILMAGCSHAGIGRIQKKAADLIGRYPDRVIGGFHLYNPSAQIYECDEVIDATAAELLPTGSRYYTCHCTGQKAFDRMKMQLAERLEYMATGSVLEIGE